MEGFFLFTALLPVLIVLVAGFGFYRLLSIGLWMQARDQGIDLPLLKLFGMRARRSDPERIVPPLIAAHRAGLGLDSDRLEAHYLAGGNVERVVQALIAADRAGIDLPFASAAALDLAGHDVLELVRSSTDPDDFLRRLDLAVLGPSRSGVAGTR